MTDFLTLCQDTARECGITGGGPTAVTSQTGEYLRIVSWVIDAWKEIQQDMDWRWMRKKFTMPTVDGTGEYAYTACTDVDLTTAIDRFKRWHLDVRRNPPIIYLTSAGVSGQTILTWAPWDDFEYLYLFGSRQSQTSRPIHITVDPEDKIRLGPTPDDIYTLTGTYYKSGQTLAADDDVPEMPTQYHRLIMYKAMEYYADYEAADNVERRSIKGTAQVLPNLIRNQGPKVRIGSSLA